MWVEDGSTREGDWVSTCQSFAWAGSDGNLWLGNCEGGGGYVCGDNTILVSI